MNKAKIIAELENMVVARLFGRQWRTDRETFSAVHRKLIQMGLVEQICDEPPTWQNTALGKELDVDLFEVFLGLISECDMLSILEERGLFDESEFDAIEECTSDLLSGYVKRAYYDYRKAAKFLH